MSSKISALTSQSVINTGDYTVIYNDSNNYKLNLQTSLANYLSGLTAPFTIGSYRQAGSLSNNPKISLVGNITGQTAHGFSDENNFQSNSIYDYNSFDAITQIYGRTTGSYACHWAGFQARGKLITGNLINYYGLSINPEVSAGSSNIQSCRMLNCSAPIIGAGSSITTVYALQIGDLKQASVTYGVGIAQEYATTHNWFVGPTSFGYGSITPSNNQVYITPAANNRGINIKNYSLTSNNSYPALEIAGTWNTSAAPSALKINITDTASSTGLLIEAQKDSSKVFSVTKSGIAESCGYATLPGAYITSSGSMSLSSSHNGRTIISSNTTGITYTIASGLPVGFSCQIIQTSTGSITFTGAAGVTMNSYGGLTQIAGRYGSAAVQYIGAESYVLAGNLS